MAFEDENDEDLSPDMNAVKSIETFDDRVFRDITNGEGNQSSVLFKKEELLSLDDNQRFL